MKTWREATQDALITGGAAGAASLAMLAARGAADNHSAAAPINAASHMVWGDEALQADRPTARHTLTGAALHAASAVFWAALQGKLLGAPSNRGLAANARNAALTTGLAALVDFKLVPQRFTPGFEHRLSTRSLVLVYGALAVGLAVGSELAGRRRARTAALREPASSQPTAHIEHSEHSTPQVDYFLDEVDATAHQGGGGSPAIKPNKDLGEDGKPLVDTPHNPRM